MIAIVRFFLLPLRLLVYVYYSLRNLNRTGDVLFHRVPDRFTMVRPVGVLAFFVPRQETHFIEYLALLRVFAESPELRTLIFLVPDIHATWSEVEQLGVALQKIESSGKQLLAYTEGGNLKTLYLMTFAARRYAAPHANFILDYPAADGYFLKSVIARFGVTVETHHAGKFKAEGFEMFTRTGYSPAARKNLKELLGDFRARIDLRFEQVADSGGTQLQRLARKQILAETSDVLATGFFHRAVGASVFEDWLRGAITPDGRPVDPETAPDMIPPEEISDEVMHEFGPVSVAADSPDTTNRTNATQALANAEANNAAELQRRFKQDIKARRRTTTEQALYNRQRRRKYSPLRLRGLPSVALVSMDGPISMGRAGEPPRGYGIAAMPFRELIEGLGDGPEEAVFLYINSPGGGADASELLFDSIYRLSRTKPVFAIVGSIAASGGYYLACAANRIYASPLSILGSIGVIRIRPNLAGLYKKLGVKRESIFQDPTRDIFSEAGPLSAPAIKLMKQTMQSTYDLFLARVAQGRNQSVAEVSRQAEGRVFGGERFLQTRMIDGSFSFLEALDEYRTTVGYRNDQQFNLNFYPEVRADLRSLVGVRDGLSARLSQLLSAFLRAAASDETGFGVDLALEKHERFAAELETVAGSPGLAYAPWQLLLRNF